MGGLADIIRGIVGVADTVTRSAQVDVIHQQWASQDTMGKVTFSPPAGVIRKAVVERKTRLVKKANAQDIEAKHYVLFVHPIPPLGAAGRQEPVDERDQITLPGGLTGPIAEINEVLDPATGRGYVTEVWMGDSGGRGR